MVFFIPKSKAQNQDAADYLQERHAFTENGDGNENGNQRIDVAQDRGFLTAQIFQSGEIQAVGNTCMEETYNQKTNPTGGVQSM